MPAWNGRKGPFLDDLAAAGFSPDAVDTVVCTHLHVDHVGWNTRLVGGRWVPTFPNARYLLSKTELDHYRKMTDSSRSAIFEDSIKPIIDEGLVDFIEAGDAICAELSLFATPGHSPGHLSVQLKSRGDEAMFVADAIHHPCQIAHPDWSSTADIDPFQSARTRHALLRRVAGTPVVILGGHFAGGTVVRDGEAFRLVM
jgi:glyoxylase-like metal-dependent hydrolase (beta-lactamase superfamily II)